MIITANMESILPHWYLVGATLKNDIVNNEIAITFLLIPQNNTSFYDFHL
jgi:hypothetical protein